MWNTKKPLTCPVCKTPLGYLSKTENNSFVCQDCGWIYRWNKEGKLQAPTKYTSVIKAECGCGSCQYRDDRKKK